MRPDFVTYFLTLFSLFMIWKGESGKNVEVGPQGNIELINGIHTNSDYDAETLVNEVFATGACDLITNIESIGNSGGIGYFSNAEEIIGFNEGVILATGAIGNAEGPNNASDTSGDFFDTSGDQDLNLIADEDVYDAVGIEFDFVPLDSFVVFRYVFASEEYCEFAGSAYNDVFGFFVSGPGMNGGFTGNAENVALIPGSDDFVAINSVNRTTNSGYYIGNERQENADECNVPFQASQQDFIEYDGFTVVLTAVLKVHPCSEYHIRMVIGDVKDNYYDSAVFLEANSFNLGGQIDVSAVGTPQNGSETVDEGCNDGYFLFERADDELIDYPATVNYYLSSQGSASPGVDFEPVLQSIIIPAGASSVSLPLETINDDLTEPDESVILVLDIPCACYQDSATLLIVEPELLEASLNDVLVCENSNTQHSPAVQGGNPPYSYLWSNGEETEEINIPASGPDKYFVTVVDDCGHESIDSCQIIVTQIPTASLQGDTAICEGESAFFELNFSGIGPYGVTYNIDGGESLSVSGIEDTVYHLMVTQEGNYQLQQMADQVCEGSISGTGYLNVMEINADFDKADVSCTGFNDGLIETVITGDNPPFTLNWGQGLGNESTVDNLAPGVYNLVVADTIGCEEEFEISIIEPDSLKNIEIDCESLNLPDLNLGATGGVPPYLYSVDGEIFSDESLFDELVAGEHYDLVIQDANGCLLAQDFIMPASYESMFELSPQEDVRPDEEFQIQVSLNIPENLVASVIWAPEDHLSCSDCLEPVFSHSIEGNYTYFVQITDVFGCRSFASIEIKIGPDINYFIPTIFSPDGDKVNDTFFPHFNEGQVTRILSFQVFNRWGGMVHEASNFLPNAERKGWDGKLAGEEVNSGVFVYLIKIELRDGSHKTITGDVVLIR